MTLLDDLVDLDTCAVSDALDHLGLPGATVNLRALWPRSTVVAGRVRTVQAGPRETDGPSTHIASAVVMDAAPGDAIVIANGGRVDVSCWGGILSHGAVERQVSCVIVDGACRDIAESQALGLPVYGRAVVPVTARGRIVQLSMDLPIHVDGVLVQSNDLVIADACGVVFVSARYAKEVIAEARAIVEQERHMVESVRAGRSLVEAMHDSQFTVPSTGRQP